MGGRDIEQELVPFSTADLLVPARGATRFAVLTDLHLGAVGERPRWHHPHLAPGELYSVFAAVLDGLVAQHVDALLLLGDLSHHGDGETLRTVADAAARIGLPVRVVPGNHDLTEGGAFAAAFPAGSAVASAGAAPEEVAGTSVVGIGLVCGDDGALRPAEVPDSRRWPDRLVTVLTHYPLLSLAEPLRVACLQDAGQLDATAEVVTALYAHTAPTLVLAGHLHVRAEISEGDVLQVSVASLVEPPHEIAIIDVADGPVPRVDIDRFCAHPSAPDAPPVLTGRRSRWQWAADRGWEAAR
jgi:DNA repair exonuclease SbcCD nuclease subunit